MSPESLKDAAIACLSRAMESEGSSPQFAAMYRARGEALCERVAEMEGLSPSLVKKVIYAHAAFL